MTAPENFAAPRRFNPAAWLAEYEALGGKVSVMHRTGGAEAGFWVCCTLPRDPEGRGYELQAELNAAGNAALCDYVIALRGYLEVPSAA